MARPNILGKTMLLNLRVPVNISEQVSKKAAAEGTNVSEVVRKLLQSYLNS